MKKIYFSGHNIAYWQSSIPCQVISHNSIFPVLFKLNKVFIHKLYKLIGIFLFNNYLNYENYVFNPSLFSSNLFHYIFINLSDLTIKFYNLNYFYIFFWIVNFM